jgi:hypothetical protein
MFLLPLRATAVKHLRNDSAVGRTVEPDRR